MPGLNRSVDRFVAFALRENLHVALVNQPDGHMPSTSSIRRAIREWPSGRWSSSCARTCSSDDHPMTAACSTIAVWQKPAHRAPAPHSGSSGRWGNWMFMPDSPTWKGMSCATRRYLRAIEVPRRQRTPRTCEGVDDDGGVRPRPPGHAAAGRDGARRPAPRLTVSYPLAFPCRISDFPKDFQGWCGRGDSNPMALRPSPEGNGGPPGGWPVRHIASASPT
jgi:hypothetical protein